MTITTEEWDRRLNKKRPVIVDRFKVIKDPHYEVTNEISSFKLVAFLSYRVRTHADRQTSGWLIWSKCWCRSTILVLNHIRNLISLVCWISSYRVHTNARTQIYFSVSSTSKTKRFTQKQFRIIWRSLYCHTLLQEIKNAYFQKRPKSFSSKNRNWFLLQIGLETIQTFYIYSQE